jgi:energy-converting hydrogenase Eha subunit G
MNKIYLLLILSVVIFAPLVLAEENKTANCTYELQLCVNEYNLLLEDFENNINCGTGFQALRVANQNLTVENTLLQEDLNKLKGYKWGFWISTFLTLFAVILLFSRKNKEEKDGTKK